MQELVEYRVRPLVDHPDDGRVNVREGSASVLIELSVHPDDASALRDGDDGGAFSAMQKVIAVAGGDRKPVLDLLDSDQHAAFEE